MENRPDKQPKMSPWWAIGFVWDVFFSIALPTVAFALGGRWLDQRWHTTPWLTVVGLVLSLAIASLLVRWQARRLQDIVKKSCR